MALLVFSAAIGCNGSVSAPGGPDPDPIPNPRNPDETLPPFEAPSTSLRRLGEVQYLNSLRDLLRMDSLDLDGLTVDNPVPEDEFAFTDQLLSEVTTGALEVEKYDAAAREAAKQAFADSAARDALVGCTPATSSDDCVSRFLTEFLRRTFRRPASPEEVESYRGIVSIGETNLGGVWQGLQYAVATALQSPAFLYRAEFPSSGEQLNGYALASRVSFFLWDTTPDDQLLDAAEDGSLETDAGLTAAVERLLASPRAQPTMLRFFTEWLGLDRIDTLPKNAEVFPLFNASLARSMRTELESHANAIISGQEGFIDLFNTDRSWMDGRLADFYGVPWPGERVSVVEVEHFEAETVSHGDCELIEGFANVCSPGESVREVNLPTDGVYRFSVRAYGAQAGDELVRYALTIDEMEVGAGELAAEADAPRILSVEQELGAGVHRFAIAFLNDFYEPPANRDLRVDWIKVEAIESGGVSSGEEVMLLDLPPERRGLMSMAGLLSLHAQPIDTSPTHRGLFIRTHLLCESILPAPDGVATVLPERGGEIRTTRDRVNQHVINPSCAGCHSQMDPLGLPLEHFDGIGAFRPDQDGFEIDASGELDGVTFEGALGLADTLSSDPRLADCIVRQIFRYGLGRDVFAAQKISVIELSDAYAEDDHSLRSLVEAFVLSDAFRRGGAAL